MAALRHKGTASVLTLAFRTAWACRVLYAGRVWKPTGQLPSPQPSLCERRVPTVLDSLALVISHEDPGVRFLKSAFAEWSIVIGSK